MHKRRSRRGEKQFLDAVRFSLSTRSSESRDFHECRCEAAWEVGTTFWRRWVGSPAAGSHGPGKATWQPEWGAGWGHLRFPQVGVAHVGRSKQESRWDSSQQAWRCRLVLKGQRRVSGSPQFRQSPGLVERETGVPRQDGTQSALSPWSIFLCRVHSDPSPPGANSASLVEISGKSLIYSSPAWGVTIKCLLLPSVSSPAGVLWDLFHARGLMCL